MLKTITIQCKIAVILVWRAVHKGLLKQPYTYLLLPLTPVQGSKKSPTQGPKPASMGGPRGGRAREGGNRPTGRIINLLRAISRRFQRFKHLFRANNISHQNCNLSRFWAHFRTFLSQLKPKRPPDPKNSNIPISAISRYFGLFSAILLGHRLGRFAPLYQPQYAAISAN